MMMTIVVMPIIFPPSYFGAVMAIIIKTRHCGALLFYLIKLYPIPVIILALLTRMEEIS